MSLIENMVKRKYYIACHCDSLCLLWDATVRYSPVCVEFFFFFKKDSDIS